MLADIASDELTEWIAYERVTGPLGPRRGDVLHGIHTAVVANTAAAKGRKAKPGDFIPEWDRDREPDVERMLATVRTVTAALGGADHTTGGESA
ncbi:phage tail assembly protein T [Streptomyces sp. NBC_00385]|uniref:phage tail assembly protein T n=1 Tax=Streptomyces sp. NBC_00385 TaxID=2975733 RepID=UPI002DD86D99|nr:hypothetical protein [Streptomyces sp. NBC_00385]WRZ05089.1 hypothetical protein OG959_17880 [Streptomyces sp. NBC_00385]